VFVVREADRLSPSAADTLLKVLEEPPADSVFLLLSARAHELPPTVWSRCHVVTFTALSEPFVVDQLVSEGVPEVRARLAARLTGGNLGRARRLATADDGLVFRDAAAQALGRAAAGAAGAIDAADAVLSAAAQYKKGLKGELEHELAPFLDERGRPEEIYRGAIRRLEVRFQRRERRAERDSVDWVLLAASALLRDRIAAAVGIPDSDLLNPDLAIEGLSVERAAAGLAGMEEARAALADDINLNVRLVLERAFLRLGVAA
jgi:DNA polymerase-3 subunit delta'